VIGSPLMWLKLDVSLALALAPAGAWPVELGGVAHPATRDTNPGRIEFSERTGDALIPAQDGVAIGRVEPAAKRCPSARRRAAFPHAIWLRITACSAGIFLTASPSRTDAPSSKSCRTSRTPEHAGPEVLQTAALD
jgi:hypothetical protein